MICVCCSRTLTAGGSSEPMSTDAIELMLADLLGWSQGDNGFQCGDCASGMETATADETAGLGPKGDSPAPQGDAQEQSHDQ
jgi:hypothetical protein